MCDPGMSRVAPFASVKSVRAHMVLQTVAGCGFGSGMTWSSAWMGWAVSSGPMAMEDSEETRRPGSRTRSQMGRTAGWTGICSKRRAVGQQVVDAGRAGALEGVVGRDDAEVALEPVEVVEQFR